MEQELRQAVRLRYAGHCGYCGVHESEVGAELELDHFRPRSAGGSDNLDNLVYCCPACKRHKGDFWTGNDPVVANRLLHPQRDNIAMHVREVDDGTLVSLTATGIFHIRRLRLNRPQLVKRRLRRLSIAQFEQVAATAQEEVTQLRQHIDELERALNTMQYLIERIMPPEAE